MPKRSLETLSEPMFYMLMALRRRTLCGVEIVHWIGETTEGRITLGPGTLYTILSKLTDEQMIREVICEMQADGSLGAISAADQREQQLPEDLGDMMSAFR